ncbi:hypothetical protein [Microvirga sp. G4-2]|uniref:hypothetical protein n=1 Tax=Microvirga sp. G4-2 TaxID=3434467 RepID=UPI0040440848
MYPDQQIETFLRSVGGFAVRRRLKSDPPQPLAPSQIFLCYVPAPDQERLLKLFDFAVYPVPLLGLGDFDGRGRQFRHSEQAVVDALRQALVGDNSPGRTFGPLKQRLSSVSDREPLLLPPNNFFLSHERRLSDIFRQLRSWQLQWNEAAGELHSEMFDADKLPKGLRGQEKKELYLDFRSVVFLGARPREFHGANREVNSDAGLPELMQLLRSLYRFGVPLPEGYHHDLQLEGGKEFAGLDFDCCVEGQVEAHGSHVNVYPNDYVRAERKIGKK